jgi:hypothetical protein
MQPPQADATTRLPIFGSAEHVAWLRVRLERNFRFRRQQLAFAELGIYEHRRVANVLAGERRAVA